MMATMSQSSPPSMEDYARFWGLTKDFLDTQPLQAIFDPDKFWEQLEEAPDLLHIDARQDIIPRERLSVDQDTRSLLAASLPRPSTKTPRFEDFTKLELHKVRKLKVEIPLLRTDLELDLLRFRQRVEPDLADDFLPLEPVDEEAGEGLSWPTETNELPERYWIVAQSEKLAISGDAVVNLQETLRWHHNQGGDRMFEGDGVVPEYQRKRAFLPVTPPLLPMSMGMIPYEPSSETGQLDSLSEATSPIDEELQEAEEAIFKQDKLVATPKLPRSRQASPSISDGLEKTESLGDFYSPLKHIKEAISSSPISKMVVPDLKVEVPMSPPASDQPPPWHKSVPLSEAMTEVFSDLPVLIPASESNGEEDMDTFFEQSIAPIATKAERGVEQEQLQETDTTRRVPIPVMDFSRPLAPWDAQILRVKSIEPLHDYADIAIELQNIDKQTLAWRVSGKLQRELTWVPFPSALAKVDTCDNIKDDGSLALFIQVPESINPETFIWKPEGLRILDELADSEDELEEGEFTDGRDVSSLVRKRKLELEGDNIVWRSQPETPQNCTVSVQSTLADKVIASDQIIHAPSPTPARTAQSQPVESDMSTLNALEAFLDVRLGRPNKSRARLRDHAPEHRQSPPIQPQAQHQPENLSPKTVEEFLSNNMTIPTPPLFPPEETRQYIISSSILHDRKLTRRILAAYPTADIVERDWSVHPDTNHGPRQTVKEGATTSADSLDDEADIIIAPSTGMVITSVQKIKQRSLPGQSSHSALRDRIASLAHRYERLIMLVSHDRAVSVKSELSGEDSEAFAMFAAFCSSLTADASTILISGSDDQMATWMVATMIKYSTHESGMQLNHDETSSEIFLRRAGLNAFAAQAILSTTSSLPGHGTAGSGAQNALGAFVRMPLQEKVARFEGLLGGQRVLRRVHQVLEALW